MATIKEIAQKAGVSIGTVDRVLHDRGMVNEQTKRRIWEIVKELDYQPNHAAQGLAIRKKKLKIGMTIPEQVGHPYFSDVLQAAKEKARELEQYGVTTIFIELKNWRKQEEFNEKELLKLLEEVDGFISIGMDIPMMHRLVKQAEEKAIPVVFYNLYLPEEKFLAYVGCDYSKSGRLAAGLCALAGGEAANICILSENYEDLQKEEGYANQGGQDRLLGFQEELKEKYPRMQILDKRQLRENPGENEQLAEELLKEFPDVNIVYVMNPGDYSICEAIYKADQKHQIRIITNDLVGKQIEMVEKGIISATVCQEPEKQGRQSLEIMFQYLAYGTLPPEQMCYTNLSIHIAQNI